MLNYFAIILGMWIAQANGLAIPVNAWILIWVLSGIKFFIIVEESTIKGRKS